MSDPFETSERQALRDTVRKFVEAEVLPHLEEWERAGELPRELHRCAGELGLLGVASQIDRWVLPTLAGELIGSLAVTEPDGGSDVASIRTTAKRDGDCYVVDGAKTYITSGCRADFVTTAVRTGDSGTGGISLLVMERGTPGFAVSRKLDKMGWLCSDTAELSFDGCRVPASNLVGGTFGEPLISRQLVQHTLVEMARKIDVARRYARSVALSHLDGHDAVAEVCFAKNTAVEAGQWVVDQAVQLHGGLGYMREAEIERHYRDMRILPIGGGSSEVLAGLAAKRLGYTR